MRVRYGLYIVNTNSRYPARSIDHALELVDEKAASGATWQITRRVGAGDDVVVRRGVGPRQLSA